MEDKNISFECRHRIKEFRPTTFSQLKNILDKIINNLSTYPNNLPPDKKELIQQIMNDINQTSVT